MMKQLFALSFLSLIFLSACSSTATDKRLDDNFVFQCAVKLMNDVERKVTGEDAGKVCEAAHREEMAKVGVVPPPPPPPPLPVVQGPMPPPPPKEGELPGMDNPEKKPPPVEDHDEVKPEPTPKHY